MQFQFNAASVPPSVPLDVIPADWYTFRVTASELTQTKDKDGAYLNLTLEVLEGPFKGRKQFARFNVQNSNPQAVDIAYRDLSALCHATGVIQLQDTQQLHNIPFEGKVKVRPAEGKYPETNDMGGYRACNSGQKPAGNGAGMATSAPVNHAGNSAPPAGWAGTQQPQAAPASTPWQQPQSAPPAQQAPAPWQQSAQQAPQQNQPPAAGGGFVPPWQQGGQEAAAQAYSAPPQGQPQAQPQGPASWQQPQGQPNGAVAPWQQPQAQQQPMQQPQAANGVPPWQR